MQRAFRGRLQRLLNKEGASRPLRLMTNPALRCLRRPAAKRFDGKARKSVGYGAAKPDLLLIFGAADVVGSLRAFRR